jgi:hypothetical protein
MEINDEGGSAVDAQLKTCSANAFRDGVAPDAYWRAYLPSPSYSSSLTTTSFLVWRVELDAKVRH